MITWELLANAIAHIINYQSEDFFLRKVFTSNRNLLLNLQWPKSNKTFNDTFDFNEKLYFDPIYTMGLQSIINGALQMMPLFASYRLPCYERKHKTGSFDAILINNCSYKEKYVPCNEMFSIFPGDKGLCCGTNTAKLENIYSSKKYAEVLCLNLNPNTTTNN